MTNQEYFVSEVEFMINNGCTVFEIMDAFGLSAQIIDARLRRMKRSDLSCFFDAERRYENEIKKRLAA